jgi:uncharacterized membrane protein YbhN (UPF0104 family)
VVGLVLSVAAIVFLAASIDIPATLGVLGRTQLGWLAATLLMVPAQVLLRAWRWQILLPVRDDGTRPTVGGVLPPMLIGYLANLILPARLGEPIRGYLLARRQQLRVSAVLGSVVLERVVDLASLALMALLAAAAVGAPDWMVEGTGIVALAGAVLAIALAASGIPRAVRLVARLVGPRIGRLHALVPTLGSFGHGAVGGGPRRLASAAVVSTVTWFFVAGTFWLLGRALSLEIGPVEALLIATVATLGTGIPSAPAYIGTFEVATVVAAQVVGIPGPEALALALLAHAVVTVPFVAVGLAAAAWMSISLSAVGAEAAAEAEAAWGEEAA